jgi:ribonucleotide reductase beta subunit family protein with ferritin-like domain
MLIAISFGSVIASVEVSFMSTAAHTTKSPRQLYNIAKTLGAWDPAKIDLTEDKAHWQMLNPEQREQLIKTCALFYEGEVSVSDTLAWFMLAVPDLDRRMFLSTQIFKEVKHAEFFERYFQEVCGKVDTSVISSPNIKESCLTNSVSAVKPLARRSPVVKAICHWR